MNTVFSNNLKKFRTQKNMTQEEVAESLHVNAQTVSRWECGTTLPDVTVLPELAKLYGVTIDDFFRKTSTAYENYAQRLAYVYEQTRNTEDFLQADLEFRKLQKAGTYSDSDRLLHANIHHLKVVRHRDKSPERGYFRP
ncbi:MAG: helix-turn-helix transcriptional regulator [Ruminococcaceae bacterium]|nr:helix-turn-helix transcriptional regulator [Oscillospiraceae bacterium]